MSKTIVPTKNINADVKLALIKAFRITNKRAGEVKKQGPEGNDAYLQFCEQLRDLSAKAEDLGFFIWVNGDGQTGHTYEKDYKESPDELHDHDAHVARVNEAMAELSASSEAELEE